MRLFFFQGFEKSLINIGNFFHDHMLVHVYEFETIAFTLRNGSDLVIRD